MKDKEDLGVQYFTTGVQLDKFGELYGVHRIVESDAEYRLRVIEKLKEIKDCWVTQHEKPMSIVWT